MMLDERMNAWMNERERKVEKCVASQEVRLDTMLATEHWPKLAR